MSVTIGKGAAIASSQTAPDPKLIWRKLDGGGGFIDWFYSYDGGVTWESHTERFATIHEDNAPPANTKKRWKDTSGAFPVYKIYDGASWVKELNYLEVIDISSGYTVQNNQVHGTILEHTGANDVNVLIRQNVPVNTIFNVERLGEGRVFVTGDANVFVNGDNAGSVEIANQWRSLYVRVFDVNQVKIEGNIA